VLDGKWDFVGRGTTIRMVKADARCLSVAAASILAKVTRDRIMIELHDRYPMYGFDEHKGYCTGEHGAALDAHGPCDDHRWSFINVLTAGAKHGRRAPHRVAPHCYWPGATPATAAGVVQNEGSLIDAGWPDLKELDSA
jgi:ribonuclease HII